MNNLFQKIKSFSGYIFIILLFIVGFLSAYYYQNKENKLLSMRISGLESQMKIISNSLQQTNTLSKDSALQIKELANRREVATESQSQILTNAVARVAPAVVSVVISKNVPKLTVSYENPFGDDPFFQGLGIQIPVYKQSGTTTQEVGAGTGFFISSNGYIITNKHVASDLQAQYTVLMSSGLQKSAKVIYQDSKYDIAILKVDGRGYPVVQLGDSSQLQLGETVAAIGNALGKYNNSVSVGVISGINRTIQASDENGNVEQLSGVLQTDTAINPGNSGGPLLNLSGKIVGINVATVVGSNNISFSIPINEVRKIIDKQVP